MTWRCPVQSVICRLLLLMTAVQVKTNENDTPHLVKKHFIYGKLSDKVTVYVKVLKNSPLLACMDIDLAEKETIDPVFLWIGPDGKNLKGHSNVNLTETGKLILKAFDISMSGSYSCTLSYKSIERDVTQEKENFRSYTFLVLAYRDPDYIYQVNVRYTAKPCHQLTNAWFVQNLLKLVEDILAGLSCQVKNTFHECHIIKAPEHSLQNELFISFKVSPFPYGWDKECYDDSYDCEKQTNRRVQQARDAIEMFFTKQPRVLEKEFVNVPEINYIEHSLDILRVDNCHLGFGKNEVTHRDCSGCCVVCDPGTYSSDNSAQCEICKDIQINYYGATAC